MFPIPTLLNNNKNSASFGQKKIGLKLEKLAKIFVSQNWPKRRSYYAKWLWWLNFIIYFFYLCLFLNFIVSNLDFACYFRPIFELTLKSLFHFWKFLKSNKYSTNHLETKSRGKKPFKSNLFLCSSWWLSLMITLLI